MKIIDVSEYQGAIDWEETVKGISFAILRSSIGGREDKRYKDNASQLEKSGIPYHAYHYVKATNKLEAQVEAKAFATATDGTLPLFYVIDAEYKEIDSSRAKDVFEEFERVLRHLKKEPIKVALYIAHHKYKKWNLDYDRYDYVWIPRYGSKPGEAGKRPAYPCDLWQYTETGKINGVKGHVDMNQLTGSKPLEFFIGK